MNKREIACYETDASRIIGKAEKVVFPENIKEVQGIIKNSGLDIVPRGAGTSLVGGCIPNDSIIVDMGKMNKVSNFLPSKKTIHVEAGITLKELNEKLNAFGFEFPIDTSNKGISTMGGMIATNASGDRSMRYGTMKDWVEEIEFVNGRGELMKTSKADLNDVCGMEGITGIIIGATLKVTPLIKRTASAFQTEDINEVLSVARKLKSEKEVVLLQLFSPYVSKLLGLPEKYNLIVEFNSDRGKIKGEEYTEILKIREKAYYSLASEGYYNSEDPKFFFDKLKEFMLFLEERQIPYFGHLGTGIIHPFFRDTEKSKRESVIEYIRKIKAMPGKYGIGIARKYLFDAFQVKLIQRVKVRHDPFLRLNKGKVIDIDYHAMKSRVYKLKEEVNEKESQEKILAPQQPSSGEEKTAFEVLRDIKEKEPLEKTPQEKIDEFLKEIELKDFIKEKERGQRLENTEIQKIEETKEIEKEKIKLSQDEEIKMRLNDYENTFKSELKGEKQHKIEEFTKNIPREILKKEKSQVDYKLIQNIMTNKAGSKDIISDNLDRKSEITNDEKNIIDKIMASKPEKEEKIEEKQ